MKRNNDSIDKIANRLYDFRKAIMRSKASLCKELGIPVPVYEEYEAAATVIPAQFIERLRGKYKLNPGWLLFGNGKKHLEMIAPYHTPDFYDRNLETEDLLLCMKAQPHFRKEVYRFKERYIMENMGGQNAA